MPQPLRTVVPQELRVAKDSKPPRQSANVELAVELTPSRPPRFGERPLRAKGGHGQPNDPSAFTTEFEVRQHLSEACFASRL